MGDGGGSYLSERKGCEFNVLIGPRVRALLLCINHWNYFSIGGRCERENLKTILQIGGGAGLSRNKTQSKTTKIKGPTGNNFLPGIIARGSNVCFMSTKQQIRQTHRCIGRRIVVSADAAL